MDLEIRRLLPKDFPDELLYSGNSLLDMGSTEIAWRYKEVIKAIDWYAAHDYAILGEDILREENGQFVYTYDNWYLNQGKLDWTKYVEESKQKTLSYINNYYQRNGDDYYYVLTVAPKGWKRPK